MAALWSGFDGREALGIGVLLVVLLLTILQQGSRRVGDRHRRGALIRAPRRADWLRRNLRFRRFDELSLAGVRITRRDETKHFKLIGTTGTGKSTAIQQLLSAALRRGDRAVIADPEGALLRQLGHRYRGDLVLNPFESDSVQWDLLAEISSDYDIEQLASALIPCSGDPSTQEWRAYARTFFSAVTRSCRVRGSPDLGELWRLLALASPEELRVLVQGTPAQSFLDPDNGRMFGSIRSVTCSAIAAVEFIQAQRARPFSVRDWIRRGRGVLFIPYRATQIAALRAVISAWMRLAIFQVMDRSDDIDQPVWFVIDELDALGAIDGLKDALARLRKFGGRCVLGLQSIAQVSNTYGSGDAQTIVENCGNTLILRCGASEHGGTSQFASRLIGEREVIRRQRTQGRDGGATLRFQPARRSTQTTAHSVLEAAVLPAELEQLPDLCGYFKPASSRYWRQVQLVHQ